MKVQNTNIRKINGNTLNKNLSKTKNENSIRNYMKIKNIDRNNSFNSNKNPKTGSESKEYILNIFILEIFPHHIYLTLKRITVMIV